MRDTGLKYQNFPKISGTSCEGSHYLGMSSTKLWQRKAPEHTNTSRTNIYKWSTWTRTLVLYGHICWPVSNKVEKCQKYVWGRHGTASAFICPPEKLVLEYIETGVYITGQNNSQNAVQRSEPDLFFFLGAFLPGRNISMCPVCGEVFLTNKIWFSFTVLAQQNNAINTRNQSDDIIINDHEVNINFIKLYQ